MPNQKTVTLKIWTCLRCSHDWQARIAQKPVKCPKCTRGDWDKVGVVKRAKKAGSVRSSSIAEGSATA